MQTKQPVLLDPVDDMMVLANPTVTYSFDVIIHLSESVSKYIVKM